MKHCSRNLRLCLAGLALLLALAACSSGQEAPPSAFDLPAPTPYPAPLQGLFPTPTAGLFDFLLVTPTSTPGTDVQPPAPTPTTAAVLPQTGGDLSTPSRRPPSLGQAGMVIAGFALVILGSWRMRRKQNLRRIQNLRR